MAHNTPLRPGFPDEVGLDARQLERAFDVVRRFVEEGKVPGGVAAVGRAGVLIGPRAYGWAQLEPDALKRPMTPETVFDLASVTKVLATAPAVMRLVEMGLVRLADTVGEFLPEVAAADEGRKWANQVTLWHLLTHTSGLPAHRDLYSQGQDAPRVLAGIAETALNRPPGEGVEYSCLGFILLGEIVRRVSGQPLDRFCAEQFYGPLEMRHTRFNPPPEWASRCAATERDPRTGEVLCGRVHDENARAMGGVSGNAGLFSTAADVARFAWVLLCEGAVNGDWVLRPATVRAMRRLHTPGLNEPRGLGWVIRHTSLASSAGDLLSPEAYGHTGFTGTSVWMDPVTETFYILLTNRVHPSRENDAHLRLRALFHNAAAAAVTSLGR